MSQPKSAFDTPWFNAQDRSFFNSLNRSKIPHVILTAETEDFDELVTAQWRAEGFDTAYVPLLGGGNDYIERIRSTGDGFGVAEYYGIVAYGDAASLILEAHTKPNHPKLCAIVAYYPSTIPGVHTQFPASVHVLVHLAGAEIGVRTRPEVLGIQGKKKTVRKRIDPGAGHGGSLKLAFPAYTYAAAPGFAETDLDEYDRAAERVAFSRSLNAIRKGFRIDLDHRLEQVRDDFTRSTLAGAGPEASGVATALRDDAHVVFGPTLSGGVGRAELARFYRAFFAPLPPDFTATLLSRTVGADRVVDELCVALTHGQEIPWLLPGVPATHRKIEVALVSVVCVRGGRLESEHVYWDQASVLVQVGLLDPEVVPKAMREKLGIEELPVTGAEAARAMKRGSSKHLNELIPDW